MLISERERKQDFLIIPAIDIRDGKCVRLFQGKFEEETIYFDNPVEVAKDWEKKGARILHLVDLDGAKDGSTKNFKTIRQIIQNISIPVEVGGGIRYEETIERLISVGVKRIVIGTLALENQEKLKRILEKYTEQIVIALDCKNGRLVKKGWVEETDIEVLDLIKILEDIGARNFIYTDTVLDGTLTHPNFDEIKNIFNNLESSKLIVGGGISGLEDIKELIKLNVSGVILGKALYEGRVSLEEALNAS